MLELRGVVVDARLDRCSFEARPGEVLGLVGGTGSGKSSALEVASGRLSARRGRVLLDGRDASPARLAGATALVGHDPDGPGDRTVDAWLHLWAGLDGVPPRELTQRLAQVRDRLGTPPGARVVGELSSGERRRLGLARAWIRRPEVLLLDAPGDGLDGAGLRVLTAAIREAAAGGTTVVLAAAAPHLPSALCDRVVMLRAGAVVAEASRSEKNFEARVAEAQGWAV